MMQEILNPGDIPPMSERRFAQQETLERLVDTTEHIHSELSAFIVAMTDRMAKVETVVENLRQTQLNQALLVAKHSESISWIKGAGTASLAIISVLIIWILNHLMFKSG